MTASGGSVTRLENAELPFPVPESHIMGMPAPSILWTPSRVRALPEDGNRYEVVAGELLVTPAPGLLHQRMVFTLARILAAAVEPGDRAEVMLSPADVELDGDLVQPDLVVVPLPAGVRPRAWDAIDTLLLAVEVLSPSSARADRWLKREVYQRSGVLEYWIVDLDARIVERWRPGDARPEILAGQMVWDAPQLPSPLTIDLARLFATVLD